MDNFVSHGSWGGSGIFMIIVIIWSLLWKCYSVWLAAKRREKIWFVALLALNTLGILDIIYIFGVAKKKWSDIQSAASGLFSQKK